eukprot:79652-Prorocentrum_minimum.AAC.1
MVLCLALREFLSIIIAIWRCDADHHSPNPSVLKGPLRVFTPAHILIITIPAQCVVGVVTPTRPHFCNVRLKLLRANLRRSARLIRRPSAVSAAHVRAPENAVPAAKYAKGWNLFRGGNNYIGVRRLSAVCPVGVWLELSQRGGSIYSA